MSVTLPARRRLGASVTLVEELPETSPLSRTRTMEDRFSSRALFEMLLGQVLRLRELFADGCVIYRGIGVGLFVQKGWASSLWIVDWVLVVT